MTESPERERHSRKATLLPVMIALDGGSASRKECETSMSRGDESLSTVGRFLAPPLPRATVFSATTSSDNAAASSRTDVTTISSMLSALSTTVPTNGFALPTVVTVERDASVRSTELPSLHSPFHAASGARAWLYDSAAASSKAESVADQSSNFSVAALDESQRPPPHRPALEVPPTLLPEVAQLDLDGRGPFGDFLPRTESIPKNAR